MQHGKLCTDHCPRIINQFFQFDFKYISKIVTAGLNRRLHVKSKRPDDVKVQAVQYRKTSCAIPSNQRVTVETPIQYRETCCAICQNGRRKSSGRRSVSIKGHASTSRDSDSEPPSKVVSRKHSIFIHYPRNRNCEVRKRIKITRAPCGKRIGDAVPRAEFFGDLITADQKVLSEGCESRNNHRYAVAAQDLATHWTQSYQCKTKTSQETERSSRKFLERSERPKVIYIVNSVQFGTAYEELSWNHCTSTPHPSETTGIAERSTQNNRRNFCCTVAIWLG